MIPITWTILAVLITSPSYVALPSDKDVIGLCPKDIVRITVERFTDGHIWEIDCTEAMGKAGMFTNIMAVYDIRKAGEPFHLMLRK